MKISDTNLAAVLLATLLLATAATAQDDASDADTASGRDEFEPAVDTSAEAEPEPLPPAPTRGVIDQLTLDRTEITGNQELPKVLYIVPWQKADPGDLMGKPINTLLDEVLAPLDRDEFVREIGYYDDLYSDKTSE